MKRRITLALGALALTAFGFSGASADSICTDLACATVNEGGYVLVVDGNEGNPDPADGFVSVKDGGQVCTDDNGTADDGNPDNGPESTSPTCTG